MSRTPPTNVNDVRVIKKYPNRRLYDTRISRYITLEEIRQLVLDNTRFRVEDKQSGEDITRSILLQVIAEQEEGGNPIFSSDLLVHIIRFYGDPMQSSISRYLELSLQLFTEQQLHFVEQLKGLLEQATPHPVLRLRDIAERQRPIWKAVRSDFLRSLARTKPNRPSKEILSGIKEGPLEPRTEANPPASEAAEQSNRSNSS